MLESFVIYIFLFAVMAICGGVAANREPTYIGNSGIYIKNNFFLQPEVLVIIVSFTFVFGCRYGVGVDYFHYLNAYENNTDERFEFLFKTISDFLRNNNLHYAVFFSVWAFLQITLLYYAFRNQRFLFPLLAFFLIIGYSYMSWMNIIRQELAAGVFLVSLKYLNEKKLLKYLLCVLVAYGFHRSSIVLVVIYPLFLWKTDLFRRINTQLVLYVIALIISLLFSTWIVETIERPFEIFTDFFGYENYSYSFLESESLNSRSQFQTNTGFGIYITVFKTIPIILLSRRMKDYYNSSFFEIVYSLWFIRIISAFLVGDSIILNRPFAFLSNFNMIIYSYFVYYCFKSRKQLLSIFGIAYMLVFVVVFFYIVSNGDINTSKFLFFWQQ